MAQLIITAVGPDRPGIVGELTAHLHDAGGNILDSRMVNLRGEFAMMILVDLADADASARLADALPAQGRQMGLRLSVTPQESATGKPQQGGIPYRLKTYSMDQPGIVAKLTSVLREHGVNIEELSAWQESAAFSGSPLFLTEMVLTVPPTAPLAKLRGELTTLSNQINCDVDLEPAEG